MSRVGGFSSPDEEPDAPGWQAATRLRIPDRFRREVWSSPWLSATRTVEALGMTARIEPALTDLDPGTWAGLTFDAIDPDALGRWIADPLAGTPGGERLEAGKARAGTWLDSVARLDRPVCAVTHPMIVRGVLSHALAFPLQTTLAIDLAPLSRVLLSYNGKWRLQSLGAE